MESQLIEETKNIEPNATINIKTGKSNKVISRLIKEIFFNINKIDIEPIIIINLIK
jgi:hypothetical protein